MSNAIAVGVLTDAGGAHLDAYFSSLAQTEEAGSVTLADPSGKSEAQARKALGAKLTGVYKDRSTAITCCTPSGWPPRTPAPTDWRGRGGVCSPSCTPPTAPGRRK